MYMFQQDISAAIQKRTFIFIFYSKGLDLWKTHWNARWTPNMLGDIFYGLYEYVYSDSIQMTICVFQYSTTYDHFFTNCVFIFYKTKVQTGILRCITGLNLELLRYDMCFPSEVSKLLFAHYLDLNRHFTTIMVIFLQTT